MPEKTLSDQGPHRSPFLCSLLFLYFVIIFNQGTGFHSNLFSSPGRSPGRAIVLLPASALALAAAAALAKSLTLKFFI